MNTKRSTRRSTKRSARRSTKRSTKRSTRRSAKRRKRRRTLDGGCDIFKEGIILNKCNCDNKINLDEFFKMCKELGLNSIVHDADSWKYLLNS